MTERTQRTPGSARSVGEETRMRTAVLGHAARFVQARWGDQRSHDELVALTLATADRFVAWIKDGDA